MFRLNLLNACQLCDLGVVGCAGVEGSLEELDRRDPQAVKEASSRLYDQHKDDAGVIGHLQQCSLALAMFGPFEFATALRLLRPDLPVRRVEDPALYEMTKSIHSQYASLALGEIEHPYPAFPQFEDHPINREREEPFLRNMLTFWDEIGPGVASAAILNTGLSHSPRIAQKLPALGVSYVLISHAASRDPFFFS